VILKEIENIADGKTALIITILKEKCENGYCQNTVIPFTCEHCPIVRESKKRFGVDVIVID